MKYIRLLLFSLIFVPFSAFAVDNFKVAAQLLAAAKNGDVQQVQALVNNGADINYVDNTGLSVVCTALMNNDIRAAQILQMYGADASKCDYQIKKYKNKLPKEESGGLFSGLSSAQSIALAAAGAAVVVGGLFMLTDVVSAGNSNTTSTDNTKCVSGEQCRCSITSVGICKADGTCDCTNVTPGGGTASFQLPYSPAMPNATSETANYTNNLNYYSPSTAGILKDNFALMTGTSTDTTNHVYKQNYLLMMHGYSALARGYMGMRTLRNTESKAPLSFSGRSLTGGSVMGGRPTNVAIITKNGINAKQDTSLEDRLLLWSKTNNNAVISASNNMMSSKYYNNKINRGSESDSILDDSTEEDSSSAALNSFDLAGYGTVINNSFSRDIDDLLAKVVGGKDSGYSSADYIGFMPNGQMTIFRTGGGKGMKAAAGTVSGVYTDNSTSGWSSSDTLTLFSYTLTVAKDSSGLGFTATDGTHTYKGYKGLDGLLYIDSDDDGTVDKAYTIESDNDLALTKELGNIDYKNYKALLNAIGLTGLVDPEESTGRSKVDIIANASVISPLHDRDAKTVGDILSVTPTPTNYKDKFFDYVDLYYENDGTSVLPSADASLFFDFFYNYGLRDWAPLVIFSTGAAETDSSYSGQTLTATFENSAPLVFSNLEHLFMSVVAVGLNGTGTNGQTSVSGYVPSGKIALSTWTDTQGTIDPLDDKNYKSRACGIAGSGANGIDPWCFSAAGLTDELAVSSMAGAVGAVKSAFDYLNNKQLFALLALTADGPYLATTTTGTAMTVSALKTYLQAMYQLPTEYQYRVDSGGEDYLKVFKEVFGYGLVNIERATKPTANVYYYDGDSIVSTSGNGYWRAATNTLFRSSAVFNPRAASISAPFYDVLTSSDGTLSLPRVWENEFALGTSDVRGLYMGDVLGSFQTTKENPKQFKSGNVTFQMAVSEKAYVDNMGGLDNLQFGYGVGNFNFSAGYQRHFTDGVSRFDGTANPVLSLASNIVSTGAEYKSGNWSFGARTFSGNITDESILQNDPTVTSQYQPANLGLIQGGETNVTWGNGKFAITSAIGTAHETNTVLGAQTGGLLGLGQGDTTYVDTVARYSPTKDIDFSVRSTFAQTRANPNGDFILGLSDIKSNSFSVGADVNNFSFSAAMPLAITSGDMKYAYADYDVVENSDGTYDLVVRDTHISDLGLSPEKRELRFTGSYRVKLGAFTDGALGMIYRINPNNISEFGNESIFMLKLTHKLGI
ncbi:MAG TPA: ankyrin repeat domain-containing protein [Alphaproteobacteria bacterium]|nr:ankyrin repeat domain-containing protein [Alphaproteobacteria bacterium]